MIEAEWRNGVVTYNDTTDLELSQEDRDAIWLQIKAERDRRTQTGGYYVASVGKWFHSDTFSRTQQIGLTMMGTGLPAGIQWKTMDGSFVELTPAIVGDIFQAGAASDMALFGVAEAHRTAMLLAADPRAYDFSAGWPLTYEESLS